MIPIDLEFKRELKDKLILTIYNSPIWKLKRKTIPDKYLNMSRKTYSKIENLEIKFNSFIYNTLFQINNIIGKSYFEKHPYEITIQINPNGLLNANFFIEYERNRITYKLHD